MNLNGMNHSVSMAIFRVIELSYQQKQTTTWRDIFEFLRIPKAYWEDDTDLDEKIVINSDEELDMMKNLLLAKMFTSH